MLITLLLLYKSGPVRKAATSNFRLSCHDSCTKSTSLGCQQAAFVGDEGDEGVLTNGVS